MAQVLILTPAPVRVTTNTWQAIDTAFDVSGADELYLTTQIISIEGLTSPTATLSVMTGMQVDTDDGWVTAFSNSATGYNQYANQLVKGQFLKLLRWNVTGFGGMTAMTIYISGIARTY